MSARLLRYSGSVCAGAVLLGCVAIYLPQQVQPPPGRETWLFFDGVCNLCDGFVNFVYAGDSTGRVRFGAIQKHKELLERYGAGRYAEGGEEGMTTVVVIQGDEVYVRSTAALRVLAVMDTPWSVLSLFYVIPEAVRDYLYTVVGRNRYALFGRKDQCMTPSGDFKKRFLEYNPLDEADANPITR
eukprot:TRINITY_DN19179_c0_g2_i3.p1 TRINITY_DN19179_c0_g2~~TRINITY_DN19179_c0_g2_i3.p1  ORF type:complete len:209 (-),score=25.09 TRINITY_DN19179_c0_g2_i3:27-581(-)